jgi:hypothetical protein
MIQTVSIYFGVPGLKQARFILSRWQPSNRGPAFENTLLQGESMSKIELHAPFTTFSGTVGKLVYRKVRGRTIVALKPDDNRPLSEAEINHRQHFTKAATWATAAMKNDEMRQLYTAIGEQRQIPARAAAVSDYLKRPTIELLDLSDYAGQIGNQIYFMATDNVGLIQALVKIVDAAGNLYESGSAVEIDAASGHWMYTAQRAIPAGRNILVHVMVADRPGNTAEATEEKAF